MIDDSPQTETLKRVDPDRYRAALFADEGVRANLITLYAFHYELAKVPEYVSEPMVGAIRYQWWREAVEEIYTDKPVRKHEVTTPLSDVLTQANVSRFWVDGLIDGRARDLDPRPFETIEEASEYCVATSGKLMQIAVQIAAPQLRLTAAQTDGVTSAGRAWGLVGLARAFKYYQGGMLSKLAFADITEAAQTAYAEAAVNLGKVPAEIMPALAYASLAPKYLAKMKKVDPLEEAVTYGPLAKQARMWGTVLRGKL